MVLHHGWGGGGGPTRFLGNLEAQSITTFGHGKKQLTRTRRSWKECCMNLKLGGLGLMDLEATNTNLLCKWIIEVVEPRESNPQLMLRYRLTRFNPQRRETGGLV